MGRRGVPCVRSVGPRGRLASAFSLVGCRGRGVGWAVVGSFLGARGEVSLTSFGQFRGRAGVRRARGALRGRRAIAGPMGLRRVRWGAGGARARSFWLSWGAAWAGAGLGGGPSGQLGPPSFVRRSRGGRGRATRGSWGRWGAAAFAEGAGRARAGPCWLLLGRSGRRWSRRWSAWAAGASFGPTVLARWPEANALLAAGPIRRRRACGGTGVARAGPFRSSERCLGPGSSPRGAWRVAGSSLVASAVPFALPCWRSGAGVAAAVTRGLGAPEGSCRRWCRGSGGPWLARRWRRLSAPVGPFQRWRWYGTFY